MILYEFFFSYMRDFAITNTKFWQYVQNTIVVLGNFLPSVG